MTNLSWTEQEGEVRPVACSRCRNQERLWDRVGSRTYCPGCQEAILLGEHEPLRERVQRGVCLICSCERIVRFVTYPLHRQQGIEMELCPGHLRELLGRRLKAGAYFQVVRRLRHLGLKANEVFLLHDEFYDHDGLARLPVADPEL